jgi:hypothetical protein
LAPLIPHPFEQFRCRLILRILLHQPAAHSEVENGLAERFDLVGARSEGGQRLKRKPGIGGKVSGSGALRRVRLAAVSRSRAASRIPSAASS